MSAHMKAHPTKEPSYLDVTILGIPGGKESYHIPKSAIRKLSSLLEELEAEITPWEKAIPWEVLAKDRIEKYKKAGLVLRGNRYKEGISQVQLAKMSGVHQNEISKIENGKRSVGEKVAKRLAKALNINYLLLLENDTSKTRGNRMKKSIDI